MDKQLDEQKIENQVNKNGDALSSFDDFREFLSGKVSLGENLGMDEEQLANSAQKLAICLRVRCRLKIPRSVYCRNFGKWGLRKNSIN